MLTLFRSSIPRNVLLAVCLVLPVSSSAMKVVSVVVNDRVSGSGVLRGFGDSCYVIAPMQLDDDGELTIKVDEQRRITAKRASSLAEKVGLYRLENQEGLLCMNLWPNGERVPLLLKGGRSAYMGAVISDSKSKDQKVALDSFGEEILAIQEDDAVPEIRRLGALIKVRFSPVAMVVGIDEEFGAAHAVRFDTLVSWLDEYFELVAKKMAASAVAATVIPLESPKLRQIMHRTKLRKTPELEAVSLKILREGSEVDVTGKVENSRWFAVRHFGLVGYLPEDAFQ